MTGQSTPPQSRRKPWLAIHRWLSLAFAGFWLLQAVTGVLIVYHWEIGDAAVSDLHRPTDTAALERSIAALAPIGGPKQAQSLWTTAGLPDRYSLSLSGPGDAGESVVLAGDGTVLQRKPDGGDRAFIDTMVLLHQRLLAGDTGEWIVGISGILLTSNLLLALIAFWPRGPWRRALVPVRKGPAAARSFSWHRAVGLWAVLPALVLVATGTLLRFEHGVGQAIGAKSPAIAAKPPTAGAPRIGFARAVAVAQAAIPGSRLTAVNWPSAEDATWRVRLIEPSEHRRAYGTSMVHVDAETGGLRATLPASQLDAPQSFMNILFPIHTGEFGGGIGRALVAVLGLWLATMILLGVQLWWRRRPRRK